MVNDIAVEEFVNAIKDTPTDPNTTYNATVSHIDKEGIVWVNIHGSNKETPTASTSAEVKNGDVVTVQWRNNKLYIGGNYSNPSAGIGTVQPSIDYINDLVANSITVNSINAATGYIEDLTSKNITTENLAADHATIKELDVESMAAATAYIRDLTSENITADDIIADHATIDTLDSTYATIEELHSDYAEIDLANVNNAWIEYGAMKKAEVFDENVFDLSGDHATLSKIDASKINVANLRADNLVVRRINGQPVVGGYTLIDSNSSGYASKNPQALGWYEFVNAQWVLSTDTTVDMTKAYYQEGNEVSLYDQQYINNLKHELDQRIDGAVESFTGTVVPTLTNWPYTDWYDTSVTPIHDERANHVGDIYYVVNTASEQDGYAYRFAFDNTTNAYDWVLIRDTDITKALSDISDLQTFESTTTSWIDETDEGLETIRTNHTALVGVVDKTVKESVQLWFTKANTTAPNKPTAEVTSTSTAGNAWRKVVPAYNASYPNYFYCWQYKFVDDTFGWSDVVRDIAMGETQGTARDAKNTADAALPASTFTSFESTTFKNVKDTVNEQTTKFTNMTNRLGLNSDGTGANTDIVAKESALEQTVDGISTRVGKTETKLIGMYATSSTAAGTAAKVATITPALPSGATWELGTGTIITVKFTNANTTSSPTLNVNSKGAKAIKTYANGNLSEAEYKWAAGSTFTFVYNGTNWLMQDSSVSVRINSNETQINQTANSIVSLASNNATYTKPDGTTATNAIKSSIIQTANSIESVVANNDTYTAPDGTTKTNAIKSAIKQNANDISLRVEKSGVIAAINASVEEEGGSTVKINADKVNITGTTIFSAVNSDANAKAAMLNSELEIGGRNLHKDSANLGSSWVKANATVSDGVCTISLAGTGEHRIYQMPVTGYWEIWKANTTYTVSVDAKTDTVGAKLSFQPYAGGVGVKNCDLTTDWKRYSFTFTSNENTSTSSCTYLATNGTTGNVFIRNPKLEYGNKATDWTPAPEDVQAEIDAKKSVHTLKSAYLDSGAPYTTILNQYAKEGSSVTFTVLDYSSENVKIGDSVRIAYAVSDMGTAGNRPIVYINGTVTAMNDARTSITITGHGLDTTIIDGGNIITNSIGAAQIKAGSITANKIAIGDFNNYITANENDESSINTGVPPTISDGWLYKSSATTANIWLSPVVSNWASVGDNYRITGKVKAPAAGSASVIIYARDADGNSLTNQVLTTVIPTANTEVEINGIIPITSSTFATAPKANVAIVFCTTSTWTSNYQAGYCKQMKCERMAGGSLIVDGAISTNSLSVGAKEDVLNSNIQIGGTNLLLNSKLRKSGSSNGVSFAASTLGSEYIFINGTATAIVDEYIADLQYLTAYAGCTVTISANYIPSGYFYVSTSKDGAWYKDYRQITWYNNVERRLTITLESGESLRYLRLHLDSGQTINASYRFKVEVGNKQTQWSQAPADVEKSYYGSCETPAATAAKVVTCDGFTLKVGTIVGVRFTNGNTCTTSITLNVNGTGAKTVLLSGYSTGTAERFNLNLMGYATVSFVYDGTYWRTIGIDQTSTMITRIDNTGISIHPNGTSDHRVEITSNGMDVYKGGTSVAFYGDTARIGKENSGRVEISASTVDMYSYASGSKKVASFGYTGNNGHIYIYGQSGSTTEYALLTDSSVSIHTSTSDGLFYFDGITEHFSLSHPLYISGHTSEIGHVESGYLSASKSISADTASSLCWVLLGAGTWAITAVVQFPNGSDATYRRVKIKEGSSTSAEPPDVQVTAINGYPTTLNVSVVVTPTSATNYYLNVQSKIALTLNAGSVGGINYMRAVRIA